MSSIFIQWIPGHSTIPGSDLANKAAKEAATIVTDTIHPVSFSSSIQVINETIHDALPSRERVALIYQHRKASRDVKQINNRKDDVLLARLRPGHHSFLMQYLNRINSSQDPICPNCLIKVQDLLHWLCELLFDDRKTKSVWEPPKVLRVAYHSTWACGSVRKKDLGQP